MKLPNKTVVIFNFLQGGGILPWGTGINETLSARHRDGDGPGSRIDLELYRHHRAVKFVTTRPRI